jgi:branched-chain amino acid transport system substrate-binding protein
MVKKTTLRVILICSLALVFSLVLAVCGPRNIENKPVVKIAWIGPLTGGNSGLGIGGRNSFQLALIQANADPTSRYTYEGMIIDDECVPEVAVQAALKAASDPFVMASVSHYCSVAAIATVDTFHEKGLPSIVWGAILPSITYDNDYSEVFRVNGTMIQQVEVHAADMKKWGYQTVSIIYDNSDYGRAHRETFSAAAEKAGLQILSVHGVMLDQQDFSNELTAIIGYDPDVIYFGGLSPVGIPLRKQMVRMGIQSQFDGTSGIKNNAFIEALGADAEGCVSYLEGAPLEKLAGGLAFLEAYQRAGFSEPPEAYGPFAYTAARLIIAAVEKVGPKRSRVMEELAKISGVDTLIGKVTFDDYGQNIVPLVTSYVSENGQWVAIDGSGYREGGDKTLPGILFMKEKGRLP